MSVCSNGSTWNVTLHLVKDHHGVNTSGSIVLDNQTQAIKGTYSTIKNGHVILSSSKANIEMNMMKFNDSYLDGHIVTHGQKCNITVLRTESG